MGRVIFDLVSRSNTFATLVVMADLEDELMEPNLTLFVPSDAAFASVGEEGLEFLDYVADYPDLLAVILRLHIAIDGPHPFLSFHASVGFVTLHTLGVGLVSLLLEETKPPY